MRRASFTSTRHLIYKAPSNDVYTHKYLSDIVTMPRKLPSSWTKTNAGKNSEVGVKSEKKAVGRVPPVKKEVTPASTPDVRAKVKRTEDDEDLKNVE